jgi:hypothetical protein
LRDAVNLDEEVETTIRIDTSSCRHIASPLSSGGRSSPSAAIYFGGAVY